MKMRVGCRLAKHSSVACRLVNRSQPDTGVQMEMSPVPLALHRMRLQLIKEHSPLGDGLAPEFFAAQHVCARLHSLFTALIVFKTYPFWYIVSRCIFALAFNPLSPSFAGAL